MEEVATELNIRGGVGIKMALEANISAKNEFYRLLFFLPRSLFILTHISWRFASKDLDLFSASPLCD